VSALNLTQVIDGHSHIASARYIPQRFLEGVAENIAAQSVLTGVPLSAVQVLDRMLAGYQDHDGAAQLAQMDRLGIAHAILLVADFTYALPGGFPYSPGLIRAGAPTRSPCSFAAWKNSASPALNSIRPAATARMMTGWPRFTPIATNTACPC
jgi:hypothetical protein